MYLYNKASSSPSMAMYPVSVSVRLQQRISIVVQRFHPYKSDSEEYSLFIFLLSLLYNNGICLLRLLGVFLERNSKQ